MGSIEVFDPMDETVLVSEAPGEAVDAAVEEECSSLVPLVSVSSMKPEIEIDVYSGPTQDIISVNEARMEESVGLVPLVLVSSTKSEIEIDVHSYPKHDIMIVSDAPKEESVDVQQTRANQDSAVHTFCGEEEIDSETVADGLCVVESDMEGTCYPVSSEQSVVECGFSRMWLNKKESPSLECVQFAGDDSLGIALRGCHIPSQNQLVLISERNIEEGGLPFPHNNDYMSCPRNMNPVIDLSDAVNGLLVDIPVSPRNGVPNRSIECHESSNSTHIDVPLPGINLEISELQEDVLSGQHLPSYVLEVQSRVKQVYALQSCVPGMILGSGTPSAPFRQETFRSNDGIMGNNSVAIADACCFADEGQDNMHVGDQLLEINETFVRRSSRTNKSIQKAQEGKSTSKRAKKAPGRITDLLPLVVRSRRSCRRRSARVSNWGLTDTLLKYIVLNTHVDQGAGSVKSDKKRRKKDKIQEVAGSHGSCTKNRASSGNMRLKFKLTNKSKGIIEPNPLVGTDTAVVHLTANIDKQLDLSNAIKEVTKEGSQKSLQCSSIIKLDKSATSLENPRLAVHSVHEDLGSTLVLDNCSRNDIGGRSSSDKEVEKSGVSTDDRHLNSGTSPDSEVIQVPDSQFASEVLEVHHDGRMDSSKATLTPAENEVPAISKTRKKKGNKMEKFCLLDGSDVQSSLLSSSIINKTEMARNHPDNHPKSDMVTTSDVGHELADLRNLSMLLPPAKADVNRKSKNKLKPSSSTARLDINKSRGVKGDKWKLLGKYSICENGISNGAHMKDDDPVVAGKHGMDDSGNKTNTTTSGVTLEYVSGLAVIPGGVGTQIAQPRLAWVCCDDCLKWRCIPSNLADIIDETNRRWTCKDNQDKAFADCSVPQEKSNADINAELNISDAEEGHDTHQLSGPQQSSWMLIKSNIYLHRKRKTQTVDEIMVCHCKPAREMKLGCGDECLNRMLNIECVQGTCPCGDVCENQQFQRQSYANLKWFRSGKKGYGLQLSENVTQGQFLIEYVGEVLELPAYEERLIEYAAKGHKHFYFMTLNGNEVIDACAKGNLGRFINHSCDPNCRTEKWMVNGEICIGIFAVRDIKKGEELTFDYNYVRVFGAAAKKCHCGSAQCRGYIGGDRLNNEVIVQGDSDEEFPEPVAVYENGEIADEYNIKSKSSSSTSLDVLEEKEDSVKQNDVGNTLGDKDIMNKLELPEKDGTHHSVVGSSQINNSLEIVECTQAENVDKTTLDVEQKKPTSICSVSPKRPDSLALNNKSVDAGYNSSLTGIADGKAVHSKAHPRMKISRPSKSVKSKESSDSVAIINKPLVTSSKLQTTPNKLKKAVDSPAKHRLETVEDKLNELLDNVGGICKRKDAFKGYLKLLVLTAASGDCSRRETIQSNKDLSMILDAVLKTKSRTVLTDILNKNGLQMLHSLMKKCRGNFNKIPILRKLLKIFEFLAEKKILTLEHINAEPPRPGMESFRDSILSLTEYEDRKVHQIARNFRDRWIPRPIKKFNCMEKGERNIDANGALNCSRQLGTHHQRFDHVERLSESMDCVKQSHSSDHQIDSDGLEGSPRFSVRRKRKRKSGWDQLPDAVSPPCIKEQKTEPSSSLKFDSDLQAWEVHSRNEDDERQVCEDDAPPGFSFPSFGNPHLSNGTSSTRISFSQQYPGPLKCPSEMPLGYPQERYNSDLPMAFGMSFNTVQEFGTPESSTGGGWVIAPGMPFRPFPPLPRYPCQKVNREVPPHFNGDTHMDQGCPSSSNPRLPDTIPNGNPHSQHQKGQYHQERRNSNQRPKYFGKPPWELDGEGTGSVPNYGVTPPGVALGTMANDHSDHPENVNYGVEFAGNSC